MLFTLSQGGFNNYSIGIRIARGDYVAMALRMVMQFGENPEPWEIVRRFCQGYARWIRMNKGEVLALPLLIRLRTAVPVFWCLGRSGAEDDLARAPVNIGRVR